MRQLQVYCAAHAAGTGGDGCNAAVAAIGGRSCPPFGQR